MDSIAFIGQTDVGLVRTNNEDTFIAQTLWDDRHLVCAAIDGVGGYEGGEVAAEMAKETILKFLSEYRDDDLQSLVSQAVLQANNAIYERRKTDTRFPNMSCVVSAAIIDILNDKLFIAHVFSALYARIGFAESEVARCVLIEESIEKEHARI